MVKINILLELQYCLEEQGYIDHIKALNKFDTFGLFVSREVILIMMEICQILEKELNDVLRGN